MFPGSLWMAASRPQAGRGHRGAGALPAGQGGRMEEAGHPALPPKLRETEQGARVRETEQGARVKKGP